eukprot:3749130-Prymnesium_polylepis.2
MHARPDLTALREARGRGEPGNQKHCGSAKSTGIRGHAQAGAEPAAPLVMLPPAASAAPPDAQLLPADGAFATMTLVVAGAPPARGPRGDPRNPGTCNLVS